MRIQVNYFGLFRIKFHKSSEDIKLSKKARLRDLLLYLAQQYGKNFKLYVFDPSNRVVKEDVLLNVNGVPSNLLQGLMTKLNNGDKVAFMPLFSGGG